MIMIGFPLVLCSTFEALLGGDRQSVKNFHKYMSMCYKRQIYCFRKRKFEILRKLFNLIA